MRDLILDVVVIAICGAVGGFVNVFLDDSGMHLPKIEEGVWRPGFLGMMFVGLVAALAAWLATQTASLNGSGLAGGVVSLHLSELSTAIVVGFGGARWFKAEGDQTIFRRAAAVAAAKSADPQASAVIASGSAIQALAVANRMS
jgi:hypothetical protein